MKKLTLAITGLALSLLAQGALAQTLLGSKASMQRQNQLAVSYGYTFLNTPREVADFVGEGHLVPVEETAYLELHNVSYPFARSEVKTFVDRLSRLYSATCREKLMVTSLTRPIEEQPANASSDSVHPTGMAVDMRIPGDAKCRNWLERTLLSLETAGVLDVTRERHPAHYHIALFTLAYASYVESIETTADTPQLVTAVATTIGSEPQLADGGYLIHTVRKGETLSKVADSYGVSSTAVRKLNGLRGSKLKSGQKLKIPAQQTESVANTKLASAAPIASTTELPVSLAATNESASTELASVVSEFSHKVKRGDTLWRIANRYGVSASQLKQLNGLKGDAIQVGQMLRVTQMARQKLSSASN